MTYESYRRLLHALNLTQFGNSCIACILTFLPSKMAAVFRHYERVSASSWPRYYSPITWGDNIKMMTVIIFVKDEKERYVARMEKKNA